MFPVRQMLQLLFELLLLLLLRLKPHLRLLVTFSLAVVVVVVVHRQLERENKDLALPTVPATAKVLPGCSSRKLLHKTRRARRM